MKLAELRQLTGSFNNWQKAIDNKELDLVEVAESLENFLQLVQNKYQAFITIREKSKILKELENNIEKQRPLLGWPFTMKDIFITKGIRTTASAKLLQDYIPPYSSTVYKRLQKAGGTLVAKTNCDAWGFGASTENSDFYPSRNPYDPTRVPGGSSGGAVVAVATGISSFDISEDTGGSIRQPAALSGVTGFKPTYGSISRYGAIAFSSSLDTVGVIGRRVEDIIRVFNLVKGSDELDATVYPRQKPTQLMSPNKLRNLTIGYLPEIMKEGVDGEILQAINEVKDFYKQELGITFKEVQLPHFKYGVATYYVLAPSEASSNLSRYDGNRYGHNRAAFTDEAIRRIIIGTFSLASGYYDAYYLQALQVRRLIYEDFLRAFNSVDALLLPTTPTPAFKIGEKSSDPLQLYLQDIFTIPASLAGVPGISFLAGLSNQGLPLGLQLIGPHFKEDLLVSLVAFWQEKKKTHLVYPHTENE